LQAFVITPASPVAAPPSAASEPAEQELPRDFEQELDPAPRSRQERPRPINPDLPPDMPLEPSVSVPNPKPGSPAARIAASEAALRGAMPAMSSTGGKSAALAAARNAALASQEDDDEPTAKRSWFKLWSKTPKPAAALPEAPAKAMPSEPASSVAASAVRLAASHGADPSSAPRLGRKRILHHLKTLLIAASVVIIVLGTIQAAIDYFVPPTPPAPAVMAPSMQTAPMPSAPATAPAQPAPAVPAPDGQLAPAPATPPAPAPAPAPGTTGQISNPPSFFAPTSMSRQTLPLVDITGSIPRPAAAMPASKAALDPAAMLANLPSSIGPGLRAAAAAQNPAAEYEIGVRYFDGRDVTQSNADAMYWLDRAAKAGFAPAQFRLGSAYEKGDGVTRDLAAARRLYIAAANQGHVKAMHNLAVLFAEGIDGKPDYAAAAQWFRKAASYGLADSQYNLAILYARGFGVEKNLAESYRWFALAAAKGDQDAAKKRDEIASRLDAQDLVAAKLAVQTFTPELEPETVTNLRVPPGGWDRMTAAAQPSRPKPHSPASAR
jgi:localization factor PodJL